MCGRFSRYTGSDILESRFDIEISNLSTSLKSHYNIAPTDDILVVHRQNPLVIRDVRWGFIPFWSDSSQPKIAPINARNDALENNMYKHSFEHKRCLIPANGFYEWKKTQGRKIPYYITPKNMPDGVFGFAGIYSTWVSKEDKGRAGVSPVYSAAIITCEPNEQMKTIHNRMPVIIPPEQEKSWLDNNTEKDELYKMMVPFEDELVLYPVSTYVNSPQNQGETCIRPVDNPFKDPDQADLAEFF